MKNILWLDLEMTGIDPQTHRIIEVGALVTDDHLKEKDCLDFPIQYEDLDSHKIDPWCLEQHEKNGLWSAMKKTGISLKEGEKKLKDFTTRHFSKTPILAGNSIFQDRRFLDVWMPEYANQLHYRMLDVTSLMIFMQHFQIKPIPKKKTHRALDDIRESLEEYRHYQKKIAQISLTV